MVSINKPFVFFNIFSNQIQISYKYLKTAKVKMKSIINYYYNDPKLTHFNAYIQYQGSFKIVSTGIALSFDIIISTLNNFIKLNYLF